MLKLAFTMPVRYQIADGGLELVSDAGITMVFEAEPAQALEGVEWMVVELNDGQNAFVKPAAGTTLSLSFRGDGALVGNSGCNLFKAPYTRDGERLAIGNGGGHAPGVQGNRTSWSASARSSARSRRPRRWTLRGELLDLLLADGQRALTAERAVPRSRAVTGVGRWTARTSLAGERRRTRSPRRPPWRDPSCARRRSTSAIRIWRNASSTRPSCSSRWSSALTV